MIGNDFKLIFVDCSNIKDITVIKVLEVTKESNYIMSLQINKSKKYAFITVRYFGIYAISVADNSNIAVIS